MTSNLVGFTIITLATAAWSLSPFNSQIQFKPSLHKRHNDELYAENPKIESKKFLENRKFLSRRFNDESRQLKSINRPYDMSFFKKMEDILILLKRLLLQGSKFAKSLSENISLKDTKKEEKNCNNKKMKKPFSDEISTEE